MNESLGHAGRPPEPAAAAPDTAPSAGAMLRAARESQGVHIAMLAAAIKVSPRKLDALENDRHDELPDATFTRALALTVCRALKIDAAPVLARLPQGGPTTPLEQVGAGLNTPFREKPGRGEVSSSLPPMPLVWGGVALLAAAAAILLWPAGGIGWGNGAEPASSAGVVVDSMPAAPLPASAGEAGAAVPPAAFASVPAPAPAAASAQTIESGLPGAPGPAAAPTGGAGASLSATDTSWVEIVDAGGRTLLSRLVQAGETVSVDGELPLRVRIGNARATRLVFRGQAVGLEAFTRDNVARVELK